MCHILDYVGNGGLLLDIGLMVMRMPVECHAEGGSPWTPGYSPRPREDDAGMNEMKEGHSWAFVWMYSSPSSPRDWPFLFFKCCLRKSARENV